MVITKSWTFTHPEAWEQLRSALRHFGITVQKMQLFHTFWADIPNFKM